MGKRKKIDIVLLGLVIYLSLFVPRGSAQPTSFCNPLDGIGNHRFPAGIIDKFNNNWPKCNRKDRSCIRYSPDDSQAPKIRIYSISTSTGILNGWLRVNIQFNYRETPMVAFYIVGEIDEHFELNNTASASGGLNQAKGEFVTDFPESPTCPASEITKYQLFPCGGIGRSEITIPVGVLYTQPSNGTEKKTSKGVPLLNTSEYNLYFRFSDYYCTIRRFYFRFYDIVKRHQPPHDWIFHVTPALTPFITPKKLLGASDPKPKTDGVVELDCSKEITDKTKGDFDWVQEAKLNKLDFEKKQSCWGNEVIENKLEQKYRFGSHSTYGLASSSPEVKSARCASGDQLLSAEKIPTVQHHYCQMVPRSKFRKILEKMDTWEVYEEYISKMMAKNKGRCDCKKSVSEPKPLMGRAFTVREGQLKYSSSTASIMGNTTPNLPLTLSVQRGIGADTRSGKLLWKTRIGHGVMMVMMCMFIIPLNNFITRYYKETFMGSRILYFRVWTIIHIQSIPSTWTLIIAGLVCSGFGGLILGQSLNPRAIAHRSLGWLAISLYIMLTLFGGMRCFKDSSRKICICCHWLFGNVFYIISLILILLAVGIPGSPIADEDESSKEDHLNVANFIVVGWLVVDLIMHSIMSGNLFASDRELNLPTKRYYFPVPIPVLRENDLEDTPFSCFRKYMLVIYILVALIFSLGVCSKMVEMPSENRGFGPMTCTHYNITTVREHFKESCNFADTNLKNLDFDQTNLTG